MSSASLSVRELPLFPLPGVVLFPGRLLPLHIFEYRYRILMNTILEGDRRFGVLCWDPQKEESTVIGCCAEIIRHQRLEDDRLNIWTLGQQRFRLLDLVREKPYRVGLVEWIEDEPVEEDLSPLAAELEATLRDVVQLSGKLSGETMEIPDNMPTLPRELSFWVAGNLYGVHQEQQALLELTDTKVRLERELDILSTTRNHLAARTVLKDTLNSFQNP